MFRAVCHLLVKEWLPVNDCPVHLFREPLPSCTTRENIRTRMKLDADKKTVVESWNQFVASLIGICQLPTSKKGEREVITIRWVL